MSVDPFADAAERAAQAAEIRKAKEAAWDAGVRALARALAFSGREINPGYDCAPIANPYSPRDRTDS